MLAVGGALAAGGVIGLAIISGKKRKERKSSAAMFFDGRSAGVVWAGRF